MTPSSKRGMIYRRHLCCPVIPRLALKPCFGLFAQFVFMQSALALGAVWPVGVQRVIVRARVLLFFVSGLRFTVSASSTATLRFYRRPESSSWVSTVGMGPIQIYNHENTVWRTKYVFKCVRNQPHTKMTQKSSHDLAKCSRFKPDPLIE